MATRSDRSSTRKQIPGAERGKERSTYDQPLGLLLLRELVAAKLLEKFSGQGRRKTLGVEVVDLGIVVIRVDVNGGLGLLLGEDTVQARGTSLAVAERALGAEGHGDGSRVHCPHGAVKVEESGFTHGENKECTSIYIGYHNPKSFGKAHNDRHFHPSRSRSSTHGRNSSDGRKTHRSRARSWSSFSMFPILLDFLAKRPSWL